MYFLFMTVLAAFLICKNVEIFKRKNDKITKRQVINFPLILFFYWLFVCFFAFLFVSEPMVYTDELSQTMIDNEALGTVSTLAVGIDLTPNQNLVLYKQMLAKDFLTWTFYLGIVCWVVEFVGLYKKNIRKELILLSSFLIIILSSVLFFRTSDAFVTFMNESIDMKALSFLDSDNDSDIFGILLTIPAMMLIYLYKFYFVLERYLKTDSLLSSAKDNTIENSAVDN